MFWDDQARKAEERVRRGIKCQRGKIGQKIHLVACNVCSTEQADTRARTSHVRILYASTSAAGLRRPEYDAEEPRSHAREQRYGGGHQKK